MVPERGTRIVWNKIVEPGAQQCRAAAVEDRTTCSYTACPPRCLSFSLSPRCLSCSLSPRCLSYSLIPRCLSYSLSPRCLSYSLSPLSTQPGLPALSTFFIFKSDKRLTSLIDLVVEALKCVQSKRGGCGADRFEKGKVRGGSSD